MLDTDLAHGPDNPLDAGFQTSLQLCDRMTMIPYDCCLVFGEDVLAGIVLRSVAGVTTLGLSVEPD